MIGYLHTRDPVIVSGEKVKDNQIAPLGNLRKKALSFMLIMIKDDHVHDHENSE